MVFRLINYSLFLLIVCGLQVAMGQTFTLHTVSSHPNNLKVSLKTTVEPKAFQIFDDQKKLWCEIWIRQEITASKFAASPDAQYPLFHSGVLLGLMRFPNKGSDYRGLPIKPGTYTMRYGIIPQDGNHLGAAPIVDFVLLIPLVEDDPDPDAKLTSKELVILSRKASGTNHPTVINLAYPLESIEKPLLEKDDLNHWILSLPMRLKSGTNIPLSIIIYGQAAG